MLLCTDTLCVATPSQSAKTFQELSIITFLLHLPEKVAAEDEAEHEDEEADAQHNDIHIEGEVVDVRRHAAVVFRALKTQTTKTPCRGECPDTSIGHFIVEKVLHTHTNSCLCFCCCFCNNKPGTVKVPTLENGYLPLICSCSTYDSK